MPIPLEPPVKHHERECAVCTNDFTTPKILPCGHLLCRQCLISWMDTKPNASCPLCRSPIVEPQEHSKGSSADIADAFPTDFVMEAQVECARLLAKDPICCACDDVKAEAICMQCLDMMCSSCARIHGKMSATRSHDVQSLSALTAERLASSRHVLCPDHGVNEAVAFCTYHDIAVCASCSGKNHKYCLEVRDLDDEMEIAENEIIDLTEMLIEMERDLEKALARADSRLQEMDVGEQYGLMRIDEECNVIEKYVETIRMNLKVLNKSFYSSCKNSYLHLKTELRKQLGKVTSHKHITTRATTVAPRPALIYMTHGLTNRVNSLDPLAEVMAQEPPPNSLGQTILHWRDKVGEIAKELQTIAQQTDPELLRTRVSRPVLLLVIQIFTVVHHQPHTE